MVYRDFSFLFYFFHFFFATSKCIEADSHTLRVKNIVLEAKGKKKMRKTIKKKYRLPHTYIYIYVLRNCLLETNQSFISTLDRFIYYNKLYV